MTEKWRKIRDDIGLGFENNNEKELGKVFHTKQSCINARLHNTSRFMNDDVQDKSMACWLYPIVLSYLVC